MNICTLVYMLHTILCLHLLSHLDRTIGILYIVNLIQPINAITYIYTYTLFIYTCIHILEYIFLLYLRANNRQLHRVIR